jgi:galactose mutarotase-like enzyme
MTRSARSMDTIVIGAPPGPVLQLLELGATVHLLEITCGDGVRRNVVLNHGSATDYLDAGYYLGGTIGRYANRIAGGQYVQDGCTVRVSTNDRGNHLHGGSDGFHRRVWAVDERGPQHAVFSLVSPDGDQGFPGTLTARVRYMTERSGVRIDFEASTDRSTVVNLTNHTYFNLDGAGSGTIDEHLLLIHAQRYTPVDATGIPLGEHESVAGSPFDFSAPRRVGAALRAAHEQIRFAGGIDHNFVLDGEQAGAAAVLTSPRTRTALALYTDQPGLQVYTGNYLDGSRASATGQRIRQGDGIALEPQRFPDSPNRPNYPSARLDPGQVYRSTIRWEFTAVA